MPNEVKIPKFAYPFKRNTKNSANKEKSTQEFYEEILFQDYQGQYLFNRSGLFHGGVHLYEDRFPFNDFHTNGIRAIADGKLIYYRIGKEFLENELDSGTKLKYSSSFMLLEHEMAYPEANKLKFYTLYMHMAPASEYEFTEYALNGEPTYVRNINGVDMSIAKGTKVTLGNSLKNTTVGRGLRDKKNRYEILSYGENNLKPPVNEGWNVHITNIEKEVETTVKATVTNIANMRKGCSTKSEDIVGSPLAVGDTIKINAVQTLKEKAKGRYAVISVNGVDVASTNPRTTIHKSNLTDSIAELIIGNIEENGLVTKHMTSLAGVNVLSASQDITVKAGDILGRLGCYNTREWEDEMELLVHVEVFTFDNLKKFIEDATTEYTKSTNSLTPSQKEDYLKLRPKENQICISKEKPRYVKEQYGSHLFVKLKEADNIRQIGASHIILRGRKTNNETLLKVKPLVSGATRYEVISIEKGDTALTTVEKERRWSVYKPNIELIGVFNEIPNSSKDFYKFIIKPLKGLKKMKDKEGETYVLLENQQGIDVYAKESDIEKTHGITFKAFSYMEGDGEKKVGIFEDISKFYSKREDEIPQQDKEKLNELFGKVLKHIKLDKDESEVKKNILEAGEFAALSKSNKERRRAMSHVMIKHESEWEVAREESFEPIIKYMEEHQLTDRKKMFEDRLEKLAFSPKLLVGEGRVPTFIHPIALVEGFVGGGGCITVGMLNTVVQGSGSNLNLLNALNKYCHKYEVDTPIRIAHFLAHLAVESAGFTKTVEGTRFRKSLAKTFDKYKTYAHTNGEVNDICPGNTDRTFCVQPALHNLIYSGVEENGNPESGDGYKFRGRGYIQLTHRKKYRLYTDRHNEDNPDDIQDFLENPDLLESNIEYAVESAFMYWRNWGALSRKFNAQGDINILIDNAPYDITLSSQGVNGGAYGNAHGLTERITKFRAMMNYLNLPTEGII